MWVYAAYSLALLLSHNFKLKINRQMKKKMIKWIMPAIPVGLIIVLTTCTDTEALAGKGRQAAIEFCECYKENTKEKCFEKLKDKYASYEYESDDFIKAFNEASTCGAELIKEYVKY
ncbi:hypothetical protein FACS1894181_05350 [Bacteroidia bacterium]|nr:hypothetical protein FACS1894181_05350 [Bacteroidia bacterium]